MALPLAAAALTLLVASTDHPAHDAWQMLVLPDALEGEKASPAWPPAFGGPLGSSIRLSAGLDNPEPYEAVVTLGATLIIPAGPATLVVGGESVYDGAAVSPDVAWALLRVEL